MVKNSGENLSKKQGFGQFKSSVFPEEVQRESLVCIEIEIIIVIMALGSQVDISSGDEDYDDSDYPWIQDGSNTRWIAIIARYGGCNFEQKVKQTFREKRINCQSIMNVKLSQHRFWHLP